MMSGVSSGSSKRVQAQAGDPSGSAGTIRLNTLLDKIRVVLASGVKSLLSTADIDTNDALSSNSNSKVPGVAALKAFVAAQAGGSSVLQLVTETVDLQNTDPQTITGFPSFYFIVAVCTHSPSVDLSTVDGGDGIAFSATPVGSLSLSGLVVSGPLEVVDGVSQKGIAGTVTAFSVQSDDMNVVVTSAARGPASVKVTLLVAALG